MGLELPPKLRIIKIEAAELYYADLKGKEVEIHNGEETLDDHFGTLMPPNLDLCYLKSQGKLVIPKPIGIEHYTYEFINVFFQETLYLNKEGERVFPNRKKKSKKKTKYSEKYDSKFLRKWCYLNGFSLMGKEYVRYKRSSGSAKGGSCLFVRKDHRYLLETWSRAGLDEKTDPYLENLTSYEAYRALSLSSLIMALDLEPKNILFVPDTIVTLKGQKVIRVDAKDGSLEANECITDIENNIFDGEGLLDESVFLRSEHTKNKGMMLLRSRYFKCCAFNTKLKQWFADQGITDLKQLNGNGITMAESLDDILLVASESCLKYLKLAKGGFCEESIRRWSEEVNKDEVKFGVVKTDKPTRFFDGEMVETTYQLLNTLHLRPKEIRLLTNAQMDYLDKIHDIGNTPEFLRFYLEGEDGDQEEENDSEDSGEPLVREAPKYSHYSFKSKVCLELLRLDESVKHTGLFKERIYRSVMDSLLMRLYRGRVLVEGTYATLLGNPYEFLNYIICDEEGKPRFDPEHPVSTLAEDEVYCPFFEDGEELLGSRAPHMTMGNVLYARNRHVAEVDRYFNLSRQIVVVDAIHNNIQQRLSGCDYDSDTMLLTRNKILVSAAKENYDRFLVPVTGFSSVKNEVKKFVDGKKENLLLNLLEIDQKLSDNLVGNIVNLSQCLNSYLWNDYNKSNGKRIDSELYHQIATLSILAGAEIDSAKRTPPFDISAQYDRIEEYAKEKHFTGSENEPRFFLAIKRKNKKRAKMNKIKKWSSQKRVLTAMDYLYEYLGKHGLNRAANVPTKPFFSLFESDYQTAPFPGRFYDQKDDAIEVLGELAEKLNGAKNLDGNEDYELCQRDFELLMRQSYLRMETAINKPLKVKLILKELTENKGGYTRCYILLYVIWRFQDKLDYTFKDLLSPDARPMPTLRKVGEGEKWDYVLFGKYRYGKVIF